ncbi:MAG: hypothetical protein KC466_09790, partial [Myxococcales bacterium]|nr:hypothetical protein [Myxococcales bacterium]
MKILGVQIQSPHDAGVALLDGDRLVFAANEERYDRVKMSGRFPEQSWNDCLRYTGTRPEDIDLIIFVGNRPVDALKYLSNYKRKALAQRSVGKTFESEWWGFVYDPLRYSGLKPYRRYVRKHEQLYEKVKSEGYRAEVICFPHHVTHGYASYYTAGLDDPLILIVEGLGDDRTSSHMLLGPEGLKEVHANVWPNSVGRFYGAVTKLLGFNDQRHGGKVTGLAAYGDPKRAYEFVAPLLRHEGEDLLTGPEVFRWTHEWKHLGKKIPPPLDRFSKEDIAAAFQQRLEDVVTAWAEFLVKKTGRRTVSLTGGVFANVKLNQRIHEIPGVEEVVVHPGMGDVGLAVGACFAGREILARREGRVPPPLKLHDAYLGPDYSEAEMEAAIRAAGLPFERHENVEERIAQAIHSGKVVARFNGRMEWGPRALGNRSILYHAGDRSVNDWLNEKLQRTEFMPFAPACTFEACERLFTNSAGAKYTAEFMTITFDCTPEMRERAPAAVHVDGTARPQLVREEVNPSFHRVIREYEKLSGFPVVINTSFNM